MCYDCKMIIALSNNCLTFIYRLKQTWAELRDSVMQVYHDSMSDSKDSFEKPDVTCLKGIESKRVEKFEKKTVILIHSTLAFT